MPTPQTNSGQIGYNGNYSLVKGNQPISFTKKQVQEIRKCMEDPVYFALTYVKIISVDKGLIPFNPWDFQRDMINVFNSNRFVITKCPRQSGKTTTIIAYLLHQILFRPNTTVGILANKGATARDILGRLKLAYTYLPKWMQQGIEVWNLGDIKLTNGSRVIAAATASDAVRGYTFNIIFLDEFAFVPNNDAVKFFSSTFPTISSGQTTQVLIVSTPNGLNLYHKMWKDAIEKKSRFIPIEVAWDMVPGRNQKWKADTIANMGEEQFRQEFETEFIGSSHTLISPNKLRLMSWMAPVEDDKQGLHIFYPPEEGHTYAIMADVSEGQQKDASAFSVIDVTNIPYQQVARYKNDSISTLLYPTVIFGAGKKYNNAYILVEISSIGMEVANILHHELEYENLVKIQMKGRQGQQISQGYLKRIAFGLKQSTATKRIGCSNLKALVESDKLIVNDADTILELTAFTAQKESYKAEQGNHDDLCMTLVLFGWFIAQRQFRDSLKNDIRQVMQKEALNIDQEDMVPFGIVVDGTEDDAELLLEKEERAAGWELARKQNYPFDSFYNWDYLGNDMALNQPRPGMPVDSNILER